MNHSFNSSKVGIGSFQLALDETPKKTMLFDKSSVMIVKREKA